MARALDMAAPPTLVQAFMVGLDPGLAITERTEGATAA
jgi:hypothetical protein